MIIDTTKKDHAATPPPPLLRGRKQNARNPMTATGGKNLSFSLSPIEGEL